MDFPAIEHEKLKELAKQAAIAQVDPNWIVLGEEHGLASKIWRVELELPGVPSSVIVKAWQRDPSSKNAEIEFYRFLASNAHISVPRFFAYFIDEDRNQTAIVLEDIRNANQGDCLIKPNNRQTAAVIKDLARFHAWWWNSPILSSTP